jgi:FliI/YscN family ATPase
VIARGSVLGARGGLLELRLPGAAVGDGVCILTAKGCVRGVVTALRDRAAIAAAHGAIDGVACGDPACIDPASALVLSVPAPGERDAVCTPLWTGVRIIDGLLTIGRGARVGLFGAPGAGKSTLLQMIAEGANADAVVVALVGERGREAQEWLQALPRHASIFCATSDRSAAERARAGKAAMAKADALRRRGLHVLTIFDSLARYAAALREIAIASNEPAGRGGYPASVFAGMAQLVEVAGNARGGSITLLASVLSDGDDRDPVSDSARSLLDGHIQLSSALAQAGRFPAIDVAASASRTMGAVASGGHLQDAAVVREAYAALSRTEEARALGVLPVAGIELRALQAQEPLERFAKQDRRHAAPRRTLSLLAALADTLE